VEHLNQLQRTQHIAQLDLDPYHVLDVLRERHCVTQKEFEEILRHRTPEACIDALYGLVVAQAPRCLRAFNEVVQETSPLIGHLLEPTRHKIRRRPIRSLRRRSPFMKRPLSRIFEDDYCYEVDSDGEYQPSSSDSAATSDLSDFSDSDCESLQGQRSPAHVEFDNIFSWANSRIELN